CGADHGTGSSFVDVF
nr:immunoglobulin light chain junction region [Macaca mulatta]